MSRKKKNEAWGQNGFEDWGGYMAAKKAKLEEQFHNEASKQFAHSSNLFKGIAIFVNGYTDPTADELRRLMMTHGGTYHHYMRPQITTHIIASNLPYSKIVTYRKSQNPVPICKPEWITESINAGRILNFQNYLLYPNCKDVPPLLNFNIKQIAKQESSVNSELFRTQKLTPVTDKEINDNTTDEQSNEQYINNNQSEISKINCSKNTARSTKDSEFLSEFYNNSRLHHIATMGAIFKDYINELRDKNNGIYPGLEKLRKIRKGIQTKDNESGSDEETLTLEANNSREIAQEPIIMHIDMDCFFVSVGLRNRLDLKGLPVAVTHAKGNKQSVKSISDSNELGSLSEIASCSYEARKMGVRNGMFLGQALKLCPDLKTIPYDFEGYKEVSYGLYDSVALYTLNIEAVSCDEMYVDCTEILQTLSLTPLEFATVIRAEIKEKTGCPVSTGFGNNKLQARLATKKAKPDGQFYLKSKQAQTYIGTFNVRDLPGVGYSTAQKLNAMKVQTCADLQSVSLAILQKEFGKKTGEILHNMCRGIDNSKLQLEHVRKSVSAEVNYGIRFENNGHAVDFLKKLSDEVCNRLKKANVKGRCITLKMMVRAKDAPRDTAKFMGHGLCDYLTRSKNLMTPVNELPIITREVISLWNQAQQVPEDMRGIGIQVSKLETVKEKSNNILLKFVNKPKQIYTESILVDSKTHKASENLYHVDNSKNVRESKCSNNLHVMKKTTTNIKLSPQPTSPLFKNDNLCVKENFVQDQSLINNIDNVKNQEIPVQTTYLMHKLSLPFNNVVKEHSAQNGLQLIGNGQGEQIRYTALSAFSDNIDYEVFKELPDDIRNEIVTIMSDKEACTEHKTNVDIRKLEYKTHLNTSDAVSKLSNTKGKNINCAGEIQKNTADIAISQKSDDVDIIVPSQDIDECVFNELPENIKTEIIVAKRKKRIANSINVGNASQDKQKSQENFFKHTKSNFGKGTKVKMPELAEIDMAVLIELPEDIRNEILNEYSARKQEVGSATTIPNANSAFQKEIIVSKSTKVVDNTLNAIQPDTKNELDQNFSFSQVDPEFLAALPEGMRNDVQMYCMAMSKQRGVKLKNNGQGESINFDTLSHLHDRNSSKQQKKSRPKVKCNSKKVKTTGSKNVKKIIHQTTTGNVESNNGNIIKSSKKEHISLQSFPSALQKSGAALSELNCDDVKTIISHNRTIMDDDEKASEYQDTLIKIVNHLFHLPLKQVKMQIQTWIIRSNVINEVDFLSLATFLSMLPEKKRIEDLHILLKTMHRCMVETGSCIWHRTYRKTVKYVQQYMQIEYNSSLMLPPIKCNLHMCDGDVM